MLGKFMMTWDEVQRRVDIFADVLKQNDYPYKEIVPVARGGLVPATLLSHATGIPIKGLIAVKSYNSKNMREHIEPAGTLYGCNFNDVLIVDDLIDSGQTAKFLAKIYPKASFWAPFYKGADIDHHEQLPFNTLFMGYHVPDMWIQFPWET